MDCHYWRCSQLLGVSDFVWINTRWTVAGFISATFPPNWDIQLRLASQSSPCGGKMSLVQAGNVLQGKESTQAWLGCSYFCFLKCIHTSHTFTTGYVNVCVCVWGRKRKRERERGRDRGKRERQRQRERWSYGLPIFQWWEVLGQASRET
jgi:hypothetical protein